MRLTIVQYAGDYRDAWERFEAGGKATYQAQRYSVGFVAELAQRLDQVAVICALGDEASDVVLPNKVRSINAGLRPGFHPRELVPLLDRTAPDRLVLVTPMMPLLQWARRHRVPTLATLADSFQPGGLRDKVRQRRLAHALNRPNVAWVGNHGIAACLSLLKIGVRADRIIPWDWPPSHKPSDHAPRSRDPSKPFSLVYVGSVSEDKGVGDLLRALHRLKAEGMEPALTVVGRDPDGAMQELAKQLGLGEQVRFAGLVPNEDIPSVMRSADAVVIPSRHEYPEGLPLTIYEALSARTPIIASDHPMFRGALTDDESALVFPARDDGALASAIRRLGADPDLYARLSANSEAAWQALQLPVTWGALIEHWLSGEPEDVAWIRDRRLMSGRYAAQIAARSTVPSP
jgi:glycosyltransferase involved in cell wall biosynthesis